MVRLASHVQHQNLDLVHADADAGSEYDSDVEGSGRTGLLQVGVDWDQKQERVHPLPLKSDRVHSHCYSHILGHGLD